MRQIKEGVPRGVFISYRRSDSSGYAGRLSDELERHYGYKVAFHDIDSIDAGEDFVVSLQKALETARVCIVLIGDDWLSETLPDGTRRLDDPADFVRREVEMALANNHMLVLPVLVEGARMPAESQLPATLGKLARLQAVELSESRWSYDLQQLIKVLARAGIVPDKPQRQRVKIAAAFAAAVAVLAGFWIWQGEADQRAAYTGLWYLPNGSFWTVQQRDTGLWVEETHYESLQVWQRGAGELQDGEFSVALELVFQQQPFQYLHTLRLSDDGQFMSGTTRRSDQPGEESVLLTRQQP
jgi:hypothetical protein